MAGTGAPVKPHGVGSAAIELSNNFRAGAPFSVRFSSRSTPSVSACDELKPLAEGPSCIYVGPIESASKETLEALYHQARDSYYNGTPLILDDMFDRIELKLRWYGSKYVVKYPRCSLRRQSTYADAEGRKTPHKSLRWQAYGSCFLVLVVQSALCLWSTLLVMLIKMHSFQELIAVKLLHFNF